MNEQVEMITSIERTNIYGPEYQKIQTVFKRDERNVIIPEDFSLPELAYLRGNDWQWTEKIDGTNIRLHWNGDSISVGGRTDNAQIPAHLLTWDVLGQFNSPDLWRSVFPDSNDVTIYGEGYGPKIQSGGHYGDKPAFAACLGGKMEVMNGWSCPKCGSAHAPWVATCPIIIVPGLGTNTGPKNTEPPKSIGTEMCYCYALTLPHPRGSCSSWTR